MACGKVDLRAVGTGVFHAIVIQIEGACGLAFTALRAPSPLKLTPPYGDCKNMTNHA